MIVVRSLVRSFPAGPPLKSQGKFQVVLREQRRVGEDFKRGRYAVGHAAQGGQDVAMEKQSLKVKQNKYSLQGTCIVKI